MNSKKKTTSVNRLPSIFGPALIKSEFDYRRDIRRKLDQIHHDNRDSVRRHLANDHMFAHGLLTKRYQWFTADKSYRDTCRTMWNRQSAETGRTSHLFLPSIYSSENSSPLTMAPLNTVNSNGEENPFLTDEKIKQDFLRVQPVMLEILSAPHSSKLLKYRHEVDLRKQSAQKRHIHIQATATNDNRYRQLVHSLQDV